MKRFLSLVSLLVIVLGLSYCNNSGESDTNNKDTTTNSIDNTRSNPDTAHMDTAIHADTTRRP